MLHGAGVTASDVVPMVAECAERQSVAIIAPGSRGPTWDMIQRKYGPDVTFLDRTLEMLFGGIAGLRAVYIQPRPTARRKTDRERRAARRLPLLFCTSIAHGRRRPRPGGGSQPSGAGDGT